MGNTVCFLEYTRCENPLRPAGERVLDFEDLHLVQGQKARRRQASRCMNCGVPFCQSDFGCPLHNLIPEWNSLLEEGFEREAFGRLQMTAPFPEFTGRVCPALCEKACNLADDGVTNRDNELYLIETAFANGWIGPRIPSIRTGKTVAVVGSGPSGLAAADLLNRSGHAVTVIERADRPGGLLMYGIPNMKLPKEIVARRIRLMEQEGVRFLLNAEPGDAILVEYDAVLHCCGARTPRGLGVLGSDAEGVYFAVDYLTETTRSLLEKRESAMSAGGKHVVVVGGGDTGNDCVGSVLRQGCAQVTELELMPRASETRQADNPWPEWPRTLRTDYGQLEAAWKQGADPRIFETTVKEIKTDEAGHVRAVETVRVRRSQKGFEQIPGTEQEIPCELLLIAAGFTGCEAKTADSFHADPDARGRLMPADGSHHLAGNLFSAGDMRTGQSLVVRALADGRAAAGEVNQYLASTRSDRRNEVSFVLKGQQTAHCPEKPET